MADGSVGIWIGNDLDVVLQLRWGLRLAEARQLNLVVFEHTQGNETSAIEVPLKDQANTGASQLVDEVQNRINRYKKAPSGWTGLLGQTKDLSEPVKCFHIPVPAVKSKGCCTA